MFCTKCGDELRERDKYCSQCSTPTARLPLVPSHNDERLSRLRDRKIAGVCAGIARYLHMDATAIRIIAVILLFCPVPFVVIIPYVLAWMIMPQDPVALPAPAVGHPQLYT
jgi:phage shock protein C